MDHTADIITRIRAEAAADSPLFAGRPLPDQPPAPGYADILALASDTDADELGTGLEYIFEGYLLHYGQSRLLEPDSSGFNLLAGDYMYARGLERVAALDDLFSIRVLAGLISLCSFYHCHGQNYAAAATTWLAATLLLAGSGDEAALAPFLLMKETAWPEGPASEAPSALASQLLDTMEPKRHAGIEAARAEIEKRFFPGQE